MELKNKIIRRFAWMNIYIADFKLVLPLLLLA